jgi:copper homeostasis protein (lipoprotein)
MRNIKAAVLVFAAAVLLAACREGRVAPTVSAIDPVAPAVSVKKVLAVYEGVLPCADCRGIRTELTLFEDDSTYRLVETYLGTRDGDRTVESEGTWTLRRPAIYQLHPGNAGEMRRYLIVDERQIRQLGGEERGDDSRLEYTLTRRDSTAGSN